MAVATCISVAPENLDSQLRLSTSALVKSRAPQADGALGILGYLCVTNYHFHWYNMGSDFKLYGKFRNRVYGADRWHAVSSKPELGQKLELLCSFHLCWKKTFSFCFLGLQRASPTCFTLYLQKPRYV